MLYDLLRKRGDIGLNESDLEDIIQECRIHLWRTSLPKYDPYRKPRTTVSTFLHRCASNFINQALRTKARVQGSRRNLVFVQNEALTQHSVSPDVTCDRNVEAFAKEIRMHPDKYLTKRQSEVFRKMMESDGQMMKELAESLDLRMASSLSMMLQRIKTKLTQVDLGRTI